MSGLEVIGGISAVIGIIDASIKIYDSARKDLKLSETFKTVGQRLPVILDTLQTCKNHLKPIQNSMPVDVCEALEKTLDACDQNAGKLREIFEKVIPGESDGWERRYLKVFNRLGKGNKVEELMISITEGVQLAVNNHAVKSATPEQLKKLEDIVKEMKSIKSSIPEEESSSMTFNSGGGAQTNNVNSGSGQQINNNAAVGTQNINPVINKQKEDFSFRKPVGMCLSQAPYIDSELFIGRQDEMDMMNKILRPDDAPREQRRLLLGGKGGIGKTQLAIAYANRHRDDYTSVFWLNATSEATLKDSFRSIAELIFDVQEPGLLEGEQILGHVRRWLSEEANTQWLLIFDNYDDPGQFQIENYYPQAFHGAIVVTTRRPDLVAGREIRIEPLRDPEESLEILETRSQEKNTKTDGHAKRLVKRLGGLPLALASAGALIHNSNYTFEEYLQEYENRWNVDPLRPLQLQEYQDRTLYTTWDVSYSRLEREHPVAAKLLKSLAYFDNQSLWYELFYAGIADDTPEWLRGVVIDKARFTSVMRTLTEHCFVELQKATKSWSIHNCVHDWILAALNKEVDAQQYWYAFDCVARSIKDDDWNSFGRLNYGRIAVHATRLVGVGLQGSKFMDDLLPSRLDDAASIAKLLASQIQFEAAEETYLQALAGKEQALGRDHTSTLQTVNNLGILYWDQGKLERAEEYYLRALAGIEQALGPDHTSTLQTVNNLGTLYSDQGKLGQAEEYYQRALAGFQQALGPNHSSTLNTVDNLGVLCWEQGKLGQAEEYYQRALAGKEQALGPDHTSTLNTVDNLGTLYRDQGKLGQAEEYYQRALAGKEQALGPNHPSTLNTVNNLGILYRAQGKLGQAEEYYRRALAGFQQALGPNHPSTLNTVDNLGVLYWEQGKLGQAEEYYQRALAGFQQALGPNHSSTLQTVNNLGILYRAQGKLGQAEEYYQRALAGFQQALGPDHPSTLNTVDNLGSLYWEQGKLGQAEEYYQRALAGKEQALGPDHPSTLNTVNNLGILYSDQGQLERAEEYYQRALAGYEQALGPDHPSTLNTVNNLGSLYWDQGKLEQAEEYYQRALAGYEQALGPDHPSTLNTVNNLGLLYWEQGKLGDAEEYYQRALAGYEQASLSETVPALNTIHNFGLLYQQQGKKVVAEAMFQRALSGRRKVLGPDHAHTVQVTNDLRELRTDQEAKNEEAPNSQQLPQVIKETKKSRWKRLPWRSLKAG